MITPFSQLQRIHDEDLIVCQFSRSAVEAGDLGRFLEHFALERLPHGPDLRRCFNRFGFVFDGYQHDERPLFEIPEVRAFVQSFRRAWPYWLFACHLALPDLQALTFCCLPSLQVRRHTASPVCEVQLPAEELHAFLCENVGGMNLLFDRAGMSEAENRERTRQIVDYYQRDWSDTAHLLAAVLGKTTPNQKA